MGAEGGALGLRRLPEVIAACLAWPRRDGEAGSGGFSARYGRKRRQPSTVCSAGPWQSCHTSYDEAEVTSLRW